MTPTQLTRALAQLSPSLQRALLAQLAAWQRTASAASRSALTQAVASNDVRAVVRLVLGDTVADVTIIQQPFPVPGAGTPAAIAATTRTEQALMRAAADALIASTRIGERFLPPTPPGAVTPPTGAPDPRGLRIGFVTGNPLAATRAAAYGGQALSYLRGEAIDGVRAAVEDGLARGIHPREVARTIRDVVGLGRSQALWVANLRAELESGDYKTALGRKLVNGNLARTLEARLRSGKPLTPAEIDKIVSGYAQKWRAWHAETIARTMSLDLLRSGQIQAMRDAVARGVYGGRAVTKQWVTNIDGRERPSHHALDGATVPLDGLWLDDGTLRDIPGGWNCRCAMRFDIAS